MPRSARTVMNNVAYHVVCRGSQRQKLFYSDKDFEKFLALLWKYKNKYNAKIYAYCLMSNHIHLLAQSEKGDLSDIIRDFKNHTSKKFLEIVSDNIESRSDWMKIVFEYHGKYKNKQTNQVWTHENHAEHIYSDKFIKQKINYIHENPVRAGIVEKPEEYLCSSARNYAELDSVLDVIRIDYKWNTV